jgi:hypothetical protein
LIALCLGLFTAQPASAAEVTASLDRNRIVLGETVTLVLQTDDTGQSLDGDLSALDRDFLVLDRRSETQMSIVNGSRSAQVRLSLVLEPKRNGRLTIPSLPIGDGGTRPLEINVDAAPTPMPGEPPPVFIELALTPEDVPAYVHAQLALTVRVFYLQNLTEAAISQPEPSPASVRLLDEVPFQSTRNGTRYRVLERHYAIFPERSGELVIPPLRLSGRLVDRSGRLWQPNHRGRRIEVESKEIRIDVKPRPDAFTGDSWQPARKLELMQQISAADALTVGEPVTRTVIVDALGLEENMITEPVWPEIPDARIYPDQPQGISRDDGQWVLGHKEFRYAVVPEKEGELVLPELKVDWWDTVNNRQQTAVLPARVLQVLPSATAPMPLQPPGAVGPVALGSPTGNAFMGGAPSYWRWLTGLFALLWLATLAVAWRMRGNGAPVLNRTEMERLEQESTLLGQLKRACERNDRGQTRRLLSQWIDRFGPESASGSVLEFASGLDDATLQACIHELDSAGFRRDGGPDWDSRRFWKQFDAWHRARYASTAGELPPVTDLYAKENRLRAGGLN